MQAPQHTHHVVSMLLVSSASLLSSSSSSIPQVGVAAFVPPPTPSTLEIDAPLTFSVACVPTPAPSGLVASSLALTHAASPLAWLHALRARPLTPTPAQPTAKPLGGNALVRRVWLAARPASACLTTPVAVLSASDPCSALLSVLPVLLDAVNGGGGVLGVDHPLQCAVLHGLVHTARLEQPAFSATGLRYDDKGHVLVGVQESGAVCAAQACQRVAQLAPCFVPSLPVGGVRLEGAGGINTLRAVPMPADGNNATLLAPLAVGLNFRDLLNVMVRCSCTSNCSPPFFFSSSGCLPGEGRPPRQRRCCTRPLGTHLGRPSAWRRGLWPLPRRSRKPHVTRRQHHLFRAGAPEH